MKKHTLLAFILIIGMAVISFSSCNFKDSDFFSTSTSAEAQRFRLSLAINGPAGVGVNIDPPGVLCETACEEEFMEGTVVALTAISNPSFATFDGWGGDCQEGGSSPDFSLTMDSDLACTANFSAISGGNDIFTDILNAIEGLSDIENPILLSGFETNSNAQKGFNFNKASNSNFGNLTGSFIAVFAGANGYQIINLNTGEVLVDESGLGGFGPFFGVAGATQDRQGDDNPSLIALGGVNGYILDRLDGTEPLQFDGTTFDVFPAGGDPVTNVMTHVLPGAGVGFFVFDDAQNQYVPAEIGFPKELFGDVQLISAYMHDDVLSDDSVPQPRGNFLALSQETESGVFLVKWDGSNPVRAIDNIGFDARRIRCIELESGQLICAASIFGHNRLGLMTWDGENVPVLTDFAELEAGPVGIDLRILPNGNIAVVSTGFDNNTITETVVMPNGRVESNSTRSVLEGCINPGHAIYVEDAEGLKILVTCFDSNNYFVVESEL